MAELFSIRHVVAFEPGGPWDDLVARLGRIETLLTQVVQQEQKIMAGIDDLEAKVTAETTVEEGAIVLLGELSGMVKAAGTDPARLAALTATIDQRTAKLAAALVTNTPAAAPQP